MERDSLRRKKKGRLNKLKTKDMKPSRNINQLPGPQMCASWKQAVKRYSPEDGRLRDASFR